MYTEEVNCYAKNAYSNLSFERSKTHFFVSNLIFGYCSSDARIAEYDHHKKCIPPLLVTRGNSIQLKLQDTHRTGRFSSIYHVRYVQHQVSRPVKIDSTRVCMSSNALGLECLVSLST